MDEKPKEKENNGPGEIEQLMPNPGDGDSTNATQPQQIHHERPLRSYEHLRELFKSGKGIAMSAEESKMFFARQAQEEKAEKDREEAISREYHRILNKIFDNLLVKAILGGIYLLWTIIPIIGIVIGIIYIKHENCPGQPGLAAHLISIGACALIASVTLVSSKSKTTGKKEPNPKPTDETIELGPNNQNQPEAGDQQPKLSPAKAAALGCAGCCCCCFIIVIKLIHLILFITTSVLVYKFAPKVQFLKTGIEEEDEIHYCNELLFTFAYWSFTFSYAVLGLGFLFLILCVVSYFYLQISGKRRASNPQPHATARHDTEAPNELN